MSLDKLFGVQRKIIDRDFENLKEVENYLLGSFDHGIEDEDEIQFRLKEYDRYVWFEGVARIVEEKLYYLPTVSGWKGNQIYNIQRVWKIKSVSRMKPTISVDSDSLIETDTGTLMKVLTPSGKYVFIKALMKEVIKSTVFVNRF